MQHRLPALDVASHRSNRDKDRSWLKAQMSWCSQLDVSQASLPWSHPYPYLCYPTISEGVRINTEAPVPRRSI